MEMIKLKNNRIATREDYISGMTKFFKEEWDSEITEKMVSRELNKIKNNERLWDFGIFMKEDIEE